MSGAIKISESYNSFDNPDTVNFRVSVDLMEFRNEKPILVMEGIARGVQEHVREHVAEKIVKAIEKDLSKWVLDEIKGKVERELFPKIIQSINVDAVAKIASIHAGKKLAKEIT